MAARKRTPVEGQAGAGPPQDEGADLPAGVRVTKVSVTYGGKVPLDQRYSMAEVGASLWADIELEGDADPAQALGVLRGLARESVREQLATVKGADSAAAALLAACPRLASSPPDYVTVQARDGGYHTYRLVDSADVATAAGLLRGGLDPAAQLEETARATQLEADERRSHPLGAVLFDLPAYADAAALMLHAMLTNTREPQAWGLDDTGVRVLLSYLATGYLQNGRTLRAALADQPAHTGEGV